MRHIGEDCLLFYRLGRTGQNQHVYRRVESILTPWRSFWHPSCYWKPYNVLIHRSHHDRQPEEAPKCTAVAMIYPQRAARRLGSAAMRPQDAPWPLKSASEIVSASTAASISGWIIATRKSIPWNRVGCSLRIIIVWRPDRVATCSGPAWKRHPAQVSEEYTPAGVQRIHPGSRSIGERLSQSK